MAHRVPERATIYDKDGDALAYQGNVITLAVIPGQIEDEESLLATLSPLLGLEPDEIEFLYAASKPDWYVPLGDITGEQMQEHDEELLPFMDAGLVTDDRWTRLYTVGGIAPHIVGYTGYIPAEYVDEYIQIGYEGDEQVGLAGVEGWGEPYLSGTRGGTLTVVGPNGEYIDTVQESDPKQSRSIYLSIDKQFQEGVEQALADAIETHELAETGSVVVMNPKTGAVLAMASYPDYDPVIFDPLRIDGDADLIRVLNDPRQPLLNRATQGEYPAGSTFKIVTFAAAVNSGLYTPETRYTSTGSWNRLGDSFVKYDWRSGGHGTITLSQALIVSCNSCFYDAGYNLDQMDPFLLPETARLFGYGEPTDIVGIPESAGLIPDPEWKINNVGEGWVPGDSVHMAIGQGFVLVTPLQMTRLIAAIANGGTLYRPTVIDRIGGGGGVPEEQWPVEVQGELPLEQEELEAIQNSLRDAANSYMGTSTHRFVGLPVPVSGKTGTAETVIGDPHAWFAGYAPSEPYTLPDGTVVEEPEIAIVVMVENSGEGSTVGAPLFRRIVELYYDITPHAPFPWPTE
jgi:penicillin-binding protein 2